MEIYKPPDKEHKVIVLRSSASYKRAKIKNSMKSEKQHVKQNKNKQKLLKKKRNSRAEE